MDDMPIVDTIQYKIAYGSNPKQLEEIVQGWIDKGYYPNGHPFVYQNSTGYQAICQGLIFMPIHEELKQ